VLRRLVCSTGFRGSASCLGPVLEQKHREIAEKILHEGFTQQGDRLGRNLPDSSERLSSRSTSAWDQIAGKVDERPRRGFQKTNETFRQRHAAPGDHATRAQKEDREPDGQLS